MKEPRGIKKFNQIVNHLWDNRQLLKDPDFYFDFPDYGNLPKKIANSLSSDQVDLIQQTFDPTDPPRTKKQFQNNLKELWFPYS